MAQRCEATAKRTGTRCARYAIEGGTVCRVHGGAAPAVRAAAARRVAEAKAAAAVATLGLPVDITPTEALLQEVQWTAGHVKWLRGKVQELGTDLADRPDPEHPLVWGTTKRTDKNATGFPGINTETAATSSIWYDLYAKERAHLVTVCAAALKAGVEERRVRLAEDQGELVSQALRRILDGLLAALVAAGMAEQMRTVWADAVSTIVPRELRAIAGGAAS